MAVLTSHTGKHRWLGIGVVWLLLFTTISSAGTPTGDYRVLRPDAGGRHPAVVFVSGCAGFAPAFAPQAYEQRAEKLRAQGYVVLFADYLGRRGLKNCPEWIRQVNVAGEIVAAATWLKTQSYVDPARITAMGWSYGGGAVLDALAGYTNEQLNFSRAVVFYPDCYRLRPWKTELPVLILLAGADNITRPTWCQDVAKKSAASNALRIVMYPGALHGFDAAELPPSMRYAFGTIGYHAQADAAASQEVKHFLQAGR